MDYAIVYVGSILFTNGQAYVALNYVRLKTEALDCSNKTPCDEDGVNTTFRTFSNIDN